MLTRSGVLAGASIPTNAIFIDPSAGVNGTGSYASPYNRFTDVNALTGDLGGKQILIKRGTRTRLTFYATAASNFTLGAYGSGALPIIDGSDVKVGSWTAEGSYWYYSAITTYPSVFANGTRLAAVSAKASLANTGTSWIDHTNSRVYVWLSGSADPNATTMEFTTRTNAIVLSNCTNATIKGVQAQRAYDAGIALIDDGVGACNSVTIDSVTSTFNGGTDTNLGRDGILLSSGVAASQSCVVKNSTSTNNMNCGIEMDNQNLPVISGNTLSGNTNGIEIYGKVTNAIITKNSVTTTTNAVGTGHGNAVWMADSTNGINAAHANNLIYANLFGPTPEAGIEIGAGIGHKIYNNVFYSCNNSGSNVGIVRIVKSGTDATGCDIENNIFYSDLSINTRATVLGSTVTGAVDYNDYYNVSQSFSWTGAGATYTTFATWKAAGFDTHGINTNPTMVNPSGGDFHLSVGSPAIGAGNSSFIPPADYAGNAYGSPPNIGPYA